MTSAGTENYWDEWNREWRFGSSNDAFMAAQQQAAIAVAEREKYADVRILDLGCGTGWLGHSLRQFGRVSGVDLSSQAIAEGQRRFPEISLEFGDFMSNDLSGPFDYVVSADSFAQMPDHAACVQRIYDLLNPGGVFLLMTQNKWVWEHRSKLRPIQGVPNANVSAWPTLAQMRGWLAPWFNIERIDSLDPGGDCGVLWWVENRWVRGGMGLLMGRSRWRALLERMRLGRELVIIARRH